MSIFQNSRLRYKKLLIIALPIFIALVVMLFLSYNAILDSFGSENTISSKNEKKYDIESMDYHLRSNATEYQITLFEELNEAIKENNEQKIVESVAKNFIADVYTWTNKEDMWDVGGMSYVYSKYKTTTYFEIRDTLYQLMARTKRIFPEEGQIEVKGIEILYCNKNDDLFEIEEKKYESYDLGCSINLIGPDNVVGQISKNLYLTIIKNTDKDGRYEIVVSYGD